MTTISSNVNPQKELELDEIREIGIDRGQFGQRFADARDFRAFNWTDRILDTQRRHVEARRLLT